MTTVGSIIDKLDAVREKRRALAEQDKKLEAEYLELEKALMERYDQEGLSKSTGRRATASISEIVVAQCDWDKAWPLIAKNPQLVQRRISDPAFRELYEYKGAKFMEKYGFTPFVKRKINLRSIKE